MKKVKYMLVVIILGLVALAVYQNKGFFIEKQSLGINLYFFDYQGPELPNGIYYLAVFLIGVLIAYFSTLPQKFRSRKTIRQLNE
ncbi:MAG: LapA family protein, partial [Desulfosalsimonas sp.]